MKLKSPSFVKPREGSPREMPKMLVKESWNGDPRLLTADEQNRLAQRQVGLVQLKHGKNISNAKNFQHRHQMLVNLK